MEDKKFVKIIKESNIQKVVIVIVIRNHNFKDNYD